MRQSDGFRKVQGVAPGPRAQVLQEKIRLYQTPAVARNIPCILESGIGAKVTDVDGNEYLDFVSNYEATGIGHNHPRVVNAVRIQVEKLLQGYAGFGTEPYALLGERLAAQLPPSLDMMMFMNSGSEAVETALKLARFHTRRPLFLSFEWSFHGRTFATLHLSGTNLARRRGIEPVLPGVIHAPYPYRYRPSIGPDDDRCADACLTYIEKTIFSRLAPPDEFAAVVVEPILAQGGVIVPPDSWLPRLKELCSKHGILLIADEVATGMGRTGKILASEHWGVLPDIIALAGGLSPLPLSVTVSTREIIGQWPPGSHGTTFGGNPVACAGALATLDVLTEENLLEEVRKKGTYLMQRLSDLADEHPMIGEVRGKGLLVGIELVRDKVTKEPAVEESARVAFKECFNRGLLVVKAGLSTIKLCPPLMVSHDQIDQAVDTLEEALAAVVDEVH